MNYLSVCSGIEAATVAWHHMGWNPVGFSEIEKFPSQVLAHQYPQVTNFGDMTKYKEWEIDRTIGLLVGGTPCQSFSVAGLRKGLDDPRGNLMLTYLAIARKFKPNWIIWENVPGVLSSANGKDFGTFVCGLAELGYGFSYRVLDSQYFGVPQQRKRVFVVGYFGNWRPAAAVLFDPKSLFWNIKKSRKEEENFTQEFIPSIANCLQTTCHDYSRADGFNIIVQKQKNVIGFHANARPDEMRFLDNKSNTLTTGQRAACLHNLIVRKLTPIECERLQGFPDNYTNIPKASNANRYKALGNSMAVPVMRWIGERINTYETMRSKAVVQVETGMGLAEV